MNWRNLQKRRNKRRLSIARERSRALFTLLAVISLMDGNNLVLPVWSLESLMAESDTAAGDSSISSDTEVTADEKSVTSKLSIKSKKRSKKISEADSLLLKHKYEAAEGAFRSLLEKDRTGDAYAGLAVSLAKQDLPRKVSEAEQVMRKGKEKFGDNPNILAAGGFVCYVHSGQVASPAKRALYLEAAQRLSESAVLKDPGNILAYKTQGLVHLELDEPVEAVPFLRKAKYLSPDPDNLTLLAKALLKKDPADEEAPVLIDDALSIDENCNPARLQKSIVLTFKGNHEDAYSELLSIPEGARESEWYHAKGDIYDKQGDGPSAIASWKESYRLNPRNPDPYRRLAEYYSRNGHWELAISEMRNALEKLPYDLRMRAKLAEVAFSEDKLDIAEQEYRAILVAHPDELLSLLGLARVCLRKGVKDGHSPPDTQKILKHLQDVIDKGSYIRGIDIKRKLQLSEAKKVRDEKRFCEARKLIDQVLTGHEEGVGEGR
ncbi:MAG: tetratricopeptide repeat protein [Rhodocyclaceae bacterium]|nr:tetratricopeptide repeat protein [Rhodocyclaceae bacterium]